MRNENVKNTMIDNSILSIIRPGMVFNIMDPSRFETGKNMHMCIILSYPNYYGMMHSVTITSKYGEYRLPIVVNNHVSYVKPNEIFEVSKNQVKLENFKGMLNTDSLMNLDDFINFIYEVNLWEHGKAALLKKGASIEERFNNYIKSFNNLYGNLPIYNSTKLFKDEAPIIVKVNGESRLGYSMSDAINKAMGVEKKPEHEPPKTTFSQVVKKQSGGGKKKYILEKDSSLVENINTKYGGNPRNWEVWEKFARLYKIRVNRVEDKDLTFLLTIMNTVALQTIEQFTGIKYSSLYNKKHTLKRECEKRNEDRRKPVLN